MYLINHFLETVEFGQLLPDKTAANTTNAVSGIGSLGQQVNTCVADYGRNPNFMLVDVRPNLLLIGNLKCITSKSSGTSLAAVPFFR